MANKREHELIDNNEVNSKKLCDWPSDKLSSFLNWCEHEGLLLNLKVKVDREGSCAQYGMIAASEISEGECLFEIPRPLLLNPHTSAISHLLLSDDGQKSLQSDSGWVPTLVALMYEYTSPSSKWAPYVQLVPDFDELDLPMFWPSETLSHLKNTGLIEAVTRDINNISTEFNKIVLPFVKRHEKVFSAECLNLELYKKMVAFVMAYSFTEPVSRPDPEDEDEEEPLGGKSKPMMVPMADMLNHVAKNNAHLDFGKESLKMVATKAIKEGEEIFNTYGQLSNMQLLHMYGFAEAYPNNHFDTVEISTSLLFEVLKNENSMSNDLLKKKWDCLEEMGLCGDDEKTTIVIGTEGILTEEETLEIFQVLTMDEKDFKSYQENEGWLEDEGDSSLTLTFDGLSKMPESWKRILHRCASAKIKLYDCSLADAETALMSENLSNLTRRQKFTIHVIYGQLKLLDRIITVCGGETDEQVR